MPIATHDLDAAGLQALSRLRLSFRAISTSNSVGEERSKMRGRSAELLDFRQYVAGDDPRDIDWNAVARHDELYTRIYAQEIAQPLEVYVDTSPSMRWSEEQPKLAQATTLALALADIAARSGSTTKIFLEKLEPIVHRRGRSIRHTQANLARQNLADEIPHLADLLRERAQKRSRALIVAISDGYEIEALVDSLGHLKARGHGVAMLQVLSEFELRPNIEADHTLVAGDERVRVSGNRDTLNRYTKRLNTFLNQWRRETTTLNAPYALAEAEAALHDLATKALPLSGLVRRR